MTNENLVRCIRFALFSRRSALDLSQQEMAEACGLSTEAYRHAETNATFVGVLGFLRIAGALDVSVLDLLPVDRLGERAAKRRPPSYTHRVAPKKRKEHGSLTTR